MVNDRDRNDAYDQAITRAVQQKNRAHAQSSEPINVLDIGSGSGLLAMTAARAGADQVTTVEADIVLARVTKKVIPANGMNGKIDSIHNRSTNIPSSRGYDKQSAHCRI